MFELLRILAETIAKLISVDSMRMAKKDKCPPSTNM